MSKSVEEIINMWKARLEVLTDLQRTMDIQALEIEAVVKYFDDVNVVRNFVNSQQSL